MSEIVTEWSWMLWLVLYLCYCGILSDDDRAMTSSQGAALEEGPCNQQSPGELRSSSTSCIHLTLMTRHEMAA